MSRLTTALRDLLGRASSAGTTPLSEAVSRIGEIDLSSSSDAELRSAFASLRRAGYAGQVDGLTERVFALVDEAVRRRLGVWRIFDPGVEKQDLGRYETLAGRVIDAGPYRDRIEFYADPAYLDSAAFRRSVRSAVGPMALGGDEAVVVETMVCVTERLRTTPAPEIHLPTEFYRALRAVDTKGVADFRASQEQLAAGLLLCQGQIVEMDAGEGKTLAAAFPAVLRLFSGESVHVITANDYLAARDADWLAPVFEFLGVTVGAVLGYMEDEERRHAYRQEIVYGTLREFGFDFLRDNLKLPPDRGVQGTLQSAIVDEADHVLIDQARTPLIISGEPTGGLRALQKTRRAVEELVSLQARGVLTIEAEAASAAGKGLIPSMTRLLLADPENGSLKSYLAGSRRRYRQLISAIEEEGFREDQDRLDRDLYYTVDARHRTVALTERGRDAMEDRLGPIFETDGLREELASVYAAGSSPLAERRSQADRLRRRILRQEGRANQLHQMLHAYVLLERDVDYLVSDGAVVLIDESTGRTLPDNRYRHGLHAALEAKEGVRVHGESETLAQVSVQGFVKRYAHLSGMTGTAIDASEEFRQEYGLRVVRMPPTHPSRRADLPTRLYPTRQEKLVAIVREVRLCRRVGRPVLVAARTIDQSLEISRLLNEHGIDHNLLNAVNTAAEAEIVRHAGGLGSVTVATNMAGRGTDVVPAPGLDGHVLDRYVALAHELLERCAGRVELSCGSDDEAGILSGALRRSGRLSVDRRHIGGRPVVVASDQVAGPAGDPVALDFGLGLYVLGTETNTSGRVDRQLRGRTARQGASGASRFILSREDLAPSLHGAGSGRAFDLPASGRSGRSYLEGARLERHLRRAQSAGERDDEARRRHSHQYTRIVEAQTDSYYRARRRVIDCDDFHDVCRAFAADRAATMVRRHFPGLGVDDYWARFDAMADELLVDYGVDAGSLECVGLDLLAESVEALLVSRLDSLMEESGREESARLGKVLFLQTADMLWRDHLARMDDLSLNALFGANGHGSAVAEYAIQAFDAFSRFKQHAADAFLSRLLTTPPPGPATSQEEEKTALKEEVSAILV